MIVLNILILEQSAKEVIAALNGKQENWPAVAAWFVQEKGWTWWENPQPGYDVANETLGGVQAGFATYPSLYHGLLATVSLLENGTNYNPTIYHPIVTAIKNGTIADVLGALSQSPWCDPPYPLSELEGVLKIVEQNAEPIQAQQQAHLSKIGQVESDIAKLQAELSSLQAELSQLEVPSQVDTVEVTSTPPTNTLWGIMVSQGQAGNGITLSDLYRLNPGVNPTRLVVGQKIRVK